MTLTLPASFTTNNDHVAVGQAFDATPGHRFRTLVVGRSANGLLVAGERFNVERDAGALILSHPQWSLVGMGATLREAHADLMREAREVFEAMSEQPPRPLSPQAARLFFFLQRLIAGG